VSLLSGMGFGDIAEGERLFTIENLVGTNFGDTLIGSDGDNILNGAGGDDRLEGGGGADTIGGGTGADSIIGGDGIDTVAWANSATAVTFAGTTGTAGDAAGDVVDQVEAYIGSAHDDFIIGRALISDTLFGGAGNDFLGGSGLAGNPGDQSGDTLYGGDGLDSVAFSGGTGAVTIDLTQNRGWGSNAENDYFYEIESVTGSLFSDTLIGSANADTLGGFDSDDTLMGNAGNDVLIGGGGADSIIGGDGIDTVSWANSASGVTFAGTTGSAGDAAGDVVDQVEAYIGSAQDDSIVGRAFISDTLFGGAGDDFLSGSGIGGNPGDQSGDTHYGGQGIDSVAFSGGTGAVTIDLSQNRGWGSNAENDYFFEIESVRGSLFNDTLIGSANADTLDGFDSDDTLMGNAGNDVLIGGAGSDLLSGGGGIDALSGGDGDDRLIWDDPVNIDSFDGGAGYDRMTVGAVAAALDTVTGVEEAVFSSGSSSLFVDATIMDDLERITANSGGTVQLLNIDFWTSGASTGGYTLWTSGFNGEQLWIDDDAAVEFV
jgi:Ca2+-binding RTX toxin-like protein